MATKTDVERREHFETPSGIELPVDFNPANTTAVDYEKDVGAPGEFPFTRGIYRNMYRGRVWTMRQYAGYATAEESNARYKYLLAHGTTGLSVAFDLPTQIGMDSDDPLASGEVGKVGVAIDSLEDMSAPLRGHTARHRLNLNDYQRDSLDIALSLSRCGPEAKRSFPSSQGNAAKRYSQGVHRARDLHLPAGAFASAGY